MSQINTERFISNISFVFAMVVIIISVTFNSASGRDDYDYFNRANERICPVIAFPEDSIKKPSDRDSIKTVVEDTAKRKFVSIKNNPRVANELDTADFKINEVKLIGYPYAFYTPETELAFGLGGMVYFRTALSASQKPSKITVSGYYTTNNQYLLSLKPKIYFPGVKRMYTEADIYYAYELGKYYGIGNSTPEIDSADYKSNSFGVNVEVQAKGLVLDFLQIGVIYDYYNCQMDDKMSNPYLKDSALLGVKGGKVGGIGVGWTMDYRDNISFPSFGGLYKLQGILYGKALGSNFSFTRYKFDIRQYFMPIKEHIIACQLYSELTTGSPPFFDLPLMGGSYLMRGVYEGRFRDRNYFAGQVEYRKILFWRIGATAFYSFGEMSTKISTLQLSEFKSAYGFGLRFVFDPKEKINLRVDFAKSKGDSGVYFSMEEAF